MCKDNLLSLFHLPSMYMILGLIWGKQVGGLSMGKPGFPFSAVISCL